MSQPGTSPKMPDFINPGLIERVKNILIKPAAEWPVIDAESATQQSIYLGYVAPLAAIGAICGFIGRSVIGISVPFLGTYRVPIVSGLISAIVMYVLTFVGVFVVAFIVDALAPTFGGTKDPMKALKVTAYTSTPSWVAGVFLILPSLGILAALAGLYGIYLMYLGLPVLMKNPKDKTVGYTMVMFLCAVVVYFIIGAISAAVVGSAMTGAYTTTGMTQSDSNQAATNTTAGVLAGIFGGQSQADRQRVANSVQQLQQMGQQQDQARANGDATGGNVDMGKALGAIGTIVTGGNHTKPVDFHELKDLLPASLPGMKRDSTTGESNAAMGMAASNASAHYSNSSGGYATVEITDMGTLSGLAAMASKFDPNLERETDTGYERTTRVNGQLVHEQYDNSGRSGEVDIIVGNRFSVAVKGSGVDMNFLTGTLGQIDFNKLASLAPGKG